MHEFGTIPTTTTTYTRLQNYENMVVDEYEIQTFKVMVYYVAAFDVIVEYFCPKYT